MTSKVYVVLSGQYSDRDIETVHSTIEQVFVYYPDATWKPQTWDNYDDEYNSAAEGACWVNTNKIGELLAIYELELDPHKEPTQ